MSTAETATPRSFNLKRFLADQLRNIAPVFTLVALVVFFSFASTSFLSLDNMLNIIRQLSITGIIAVGLTYVILTAEIVPEANKLLKLSVDVGEPKPELF